MLLVVCSVDLWEGGDGGRCCGEERRRGVEELRWRGGRGDGRSGRDREGGKWER